VEGRGRTGKGEGRKGRKGEAEVGERSSIHQLCGVAAHSVELHFEVDLLLFNFECTIYHDR